MHVAPDIGACRTWLCAFDDAGMDLLLILGLEILVMKNIAVKSERCLARGEKIGLVALFCLSSRVALGLRRST